LLQQFDSLKISLHSLETFKNLDFFANYMFKKCKDGKLQGKVGFEKNAIVPTWFSGESFEGQREEIAVGQKLFKRKQNQPMFQNFEAAATEEKTNEESPSVILATDIMQLW
jgi:hypothetical protein